jgi:hypothetical protein
VIAASTITLLSWNDGGGRAEEEMGTVSDGDGGGRAEEEMGTVSDGDGGGRAEEEMETVDDGGGGDGVRWRRQRRRWGRFAVAAGAPRRCGQFGGCGKLQNDQHAFFHKKIKI